MNPFGNLSINHNHWSVILFITTYLLDCAWSESTWCVLWWYLVQGSMEMT